ncbi:FHA domain-containing protein [Massilia sp.]|uniref:FHA domain-containing protein n=1 Tax=Massilia sp. TaxID=1882437 RepID=UPI0028ABA3BB|nr:FHA domain-containing protein [Massilia sp.]
MNRCSNPAHPHCTVWVMPGDAACAHGHAQPAASDAAQSSDDALSAHVPAMPASAPIAMPIAAPSQRPHLHVSGFDPRAAGGRQVLKLELRGMPPDCAPQVTLLASSRLRLEGGERHSFTRTLRGEWLPVFLEFSSRGLEHGQYRVELELHSRAQAARTWVATLLILAPRADASLHDIHQTFLATHKNVRVHADDASIARVNARLGGGRVDIDVKASNAGIAHLDLDGLNAPQGKIDLGFSSIAWDEDLLEIDLPAQAADHPCPASMACLELAGGSAGRPRYLRLFALDECVLGRVDGEGDVLLAHHDDAGPVAEGLTRRLSARHAVIRRGREGFEIEDVSRYGLLVDGTWPGKHKGLRLHPGMRIELTASIPGIVVLEVTAVLAHAIVLHRVDAGLAHEAFYLLDPERAPAGAARAGVAGLPLLCHRDGGFWHIDAASGEQTPLTPTVAFHRLAGWPRDAAFAASAYPEMRNGRSTSAQSAVHRES